MELKRIQAQIETLKEAECDHELLEIEARIASVQRSGGERSIALSKRLRGLGADGEA